MATRKYRNICFPKYLMPVRKFTNIYHISEYFCSSININVRFTHTLFLVGFICHVPLLLVHKKELRTD